jgi:hypothetical protein
VKESGFGIATGEHSMIFFLRPKTTVIDKGSKPDPWWLPMDANMSDIGERLAQAQLGNFLAAVKVPGLMKKRVAAILKLVRGR